MSHISCYCVMIAAVTLELKTNLKVRLTAIVLCWGFLIASSLVGPQRLKAHAAPGSLAQSQEQSSTHPSAKQPPRTTLAGSWKLNRDQSDDPQQKVRAAEGSSSGNTGGYPGERKSRGGYPGGYPGSNPGGGRRGGYPSGGGGPYSGQQNTGQNIEANPKMQPLIHPSGLLDIELKSPEIDVTDDDQHKLSLYTDGRKLQKSKNSNDQEVAAHWTGSQLLTDEKSPLGGKMSRTFGGLSFEMGLQLVQGDSTHRQR